MTAPVLNSSCFCTALLVISSFLVVTAVLYLISRIPAVRDRYLSQIAGFNGVEDTTAMRATLPRLSPSEAALLVGDGVASLVILLLGLVDKGLLKADGGKGLHPVEGGFSIEGCNRLENRLLSIMKDKDCMTSVTLRQILCEASLSLSEKVWAEDKILQRKIIEDRALLVQEIVKESGGVSRSEELLWALIPEKGRSGLFSVLQRNDRSNGEDGKEALSSLSRQVLLPSLFSDVLNSLSCARSFPGFCADDLAALFSFCPHTEGEAARRAGIDTNDITAKSLHGDQDDQIDDHLITGMINDEPIAALLERADDSLERSFNRFSHLIESEVMAGYRAITGEIAGDLDDHPDRLSDEEGKVIERETALRREKGREMEAALQARIAGMNEHLAAEEERFDFRDDMRSLSPELEKRELELRLKRDVEGRELFAARVEWEALSPLWSRITHPRRIRELKAIIAEREAARQQIQKSLWEVRALWEDVRRAHMSGRLQERERWALLTAERAIMVAERSFLKSAPESFFRDWALSELLAGEWKAAGFAGGDLLKEYAVLREKRDSYLAAAHIHKAAHEWLQAMLATFRSPEQGGTPSETLSGGSRDELGRALAELDKSDMKTFDEFVGYFSLFDEKRRKILQASPETGSGAGPA